MDRSLITQFRKKVNDHHLVWHMYHNRDGKNQWNIICSAMDWIDVVIDNISVDNLDRKNDNVSSVKMMTFINCIDVLWEAIQQLHRVFNKTTQIPFEGDVSLFSNKMYSTDDNEYLMFFTGRLPRQ